MFQGVVATHRVAASIAITCGSRGKACRVERLPFCGVLCALAGSVMVGSALGSTIHRPYSWNTTISD